MRLWGPFYANNHTVQLQDLALKNLNSLNLIIIALYSYMSNQPLEYVRPIRSLLNKVNTSPNYQLSIVLQLRVGIPAHPLAQCMDFVWIQLLRSYECCHNCCELMCVTVLLSLKNTISLKSCANSIHLSVSSVEITDV